MFYRQWQQTIRSVTIANSPNFTADEATRHPLAHMLHEIVEAGLAKTPAWLVGEIRREAPRNDALRWWLYRGLTVGGWGGFAAAATLAGREWLESRRLARLLFEEAE